MEAYSQLPRKIQKKVREFTGKFRQDPTQSGLNFERVDGARDPKVRSIRIDQAYRAIVVHPPKGDVYLCAWVDHHDDAYRWVRDRLFEVNPRSGTLQVFEVVEGAAPTPEAPSAPEPACLFDAIDDEDLLLAGIPMPLLPAVRNVKTEADLDVLVPHLPADAADMLYMFAAGYSLVSALEETDRSKPEPEKVDVEDFQAALARDESQRSFKIVANEDELEAMLDAPLEQWRIFLHQSQRRLVKSNASGAVRVLGAAGTGKTVTAMHRANHLASSVFTKATDRILVTTFTKNLAIDLKINLRNLCATEAFARLEIVNLHRWADAFMRRQGHTFHIIRNERQRRELMETAMNDVAYDEFPVAFFVEEWDTVVQQQDVDSRDGYLTARRVGRGTRLGRKQRVHVWEVFQRYRELLEENGLYEWQDLIRETRLYLEKQGVTMPYRAIVTDEIQDFTANELKLLRAMLPPGPNDLFLVGDGHQRIYNPATTLKSCGIEIRGRSTRLKVNYRTTQEIQASAVCILEGREIDDLDGGVDTLRGYSSLRSGPAPQLKHFERENDEAAFVLETMQRWIAEGVLPESICLAARTHALLDGRYAPILKSAGIASVEVTTDPEGEASQPGVRFATMHRLKGLEFPRVILVGVQDGIVPLTVPESGDPISEAEHELRERCLLYVAMTRARDVLVVTGFGVPSSLLC
jgi:hypothetical protein